jgi:hypothetical protein
MCALSRFLDWRLLLAAICYGALHGWIKRARARAREFLYSRAICLVPERSLKILAEALERLNVSLARSENPREQTTKRRKDRVSAALNRVLGTLEKSRALPQSRLVISFFSFFSFSLEMQ